MADLIKPKKAAPAPPPPQPQRAPRTKQQQQQQPKAAAAPKARAPQVPAPPRVIAARPASTLAPAQPAVLRDRLGVRLPQGAEQGAAAAQKKKRKPLEFPGALRSEELTLCRQLETVGECSLPSCVFAHSEVGCRRERSGWVSWQLAVFELLMSFLLLRGPSLVCALWGAARRMQRGSVGVGAIEPRAGHLGTTPGVSHPAM